MTDERDSPPDDIETEAGAAGGGDAERPQGADTPDEDGGRAPAPVVGESLRAAREARGVTLEQASDLLRIESRFLVALEEERFDAIGPPVFVKGYLRHYCELLGLDSRPLLDALGERIARAEPAPTARRAAANEDRTFPVLPAVAAAAAIALAAIAWWYFGATPGGRIEAGADDAPPSVAEPASPVQTPVAGEPMPVAGDPMPVAGTAPDGGAAGAASSALTSDPPSSAATPAPASSGAMPEQAPAAPPLDEARSSPQAQAAPVSAVTGAGRLRIELRFQEDSWTEITSAGGERLYFGLAAAGEDALLAADEDVFVRLGNADGVVIRVDGRPFAYPPGSRRGDIAEFTLSPPED